MTRLSLALLVVLGAAALRAGSAAGDLLPPQIHTVAGGATCTASLPNPNPLDMYPIVLPCDGVKATSTLIGAASSVAALPDGSFLFVDSIYDLVREVSPSGLVTTVAGNGTTQDVDTTATNGVTAVTSGLDGPVAVAPLPDGGFLITEYNGSVIRMVSPGPPGAATITTIAGTGTPGHAVDPTGLATKTQLSYPSDAVPTADGGVLIADTGNEEIRLLSDTSPAATLSTVAGGGTCDDTTTTCEGRPASGVELHSPVTVSLLADGSGGYLIAEDDNAGANAIRQVSATAPTGTFTTVAGVPGASGGYNGDGGPATSALLDQPDGVLSTADGGFLIADSANERVRQVSPSGTITTIAGNGLVSYAGDGGDATAASLENPAGVAINNTGHVLIADQDDGAIREITTAPVTTIKLSPSSPNGGDGYYNSASVTAKVSGGSGTTTRCVLDPVQAPPAYDAMPSSCPYTKSGAGITGDGTHVLYVASENSFGDKENPISISLKIDSTPPVVTCLASLPKFTYGERGATLEALSTDTGGSGPLTPLILDRINDHILGKQWVIVTAFDVAGNAGGQVCYYRVLPLKLSPTPLLKWRFAAGQASSTATTLEVKRVPRTATVGVRCHGQGCPSAARRGVRLGPCKSRHCQAARNVDLRALFARHRLSVGTLLTVTVTAKGTIGRAFLLDVRSQRQPSYRATCLAPGASKPGKAC